MAEGNVCFTLDPEAAEQLAELEHPYVLDGRNNVLEVTLTVDDELVESLSADELLEFFGIDSEFLIALEVLD